MATLEERQHTGQDRGAWPVSHAPQTSRHDVDARPAARHRGETRRIEPCTCGLYASICPQHAPADPRATRGA